MAIPIPGIAICFLLIMILNVAVEQLPAGSDPTGIAERKWRIAFHGNLLLCKKSAIDDEEAIELPSHMIPVDAFAPDEEQENWLNQLIPDETELLEITKKKMVRKNKVERDGMLIKSMDNEDL